MKESSNESPQIRILTKKNVHANSPIYWVIKGVPAKASYLKFLIVPSAGEDDAGLDHTPTLVKAAEEVKCFDRYTTPSTLTS